MQFAVPLKFYTSALSILLLPFNNRPRSDMFKFNLKQYASALGYDIRICMVYTIKPCSDVYCFKLNFNISSVGY